MENNLILNNANIITMNPGQPRARAVAVRQGRIVAVGTEEDVRPYENGSQAVDLNGKTVLPGLIDNAHLSFDEKDKGSVQEGKLGDFTVVDNDPTQVPVETIQDISVAMTVINGAVVHSDEESPF
jgi:predicted amidohydrolase YtcJ